MCKNKPKCPFTLRLTADIDSADFTHFLFPPPHLGWATSHNNSYSGHSYIHTTRSWWHHFPFNLWSRTYSTCLQLPGKTFLFLFYYIYIYIYTRLSLWKPAGCKSVACWGCCKKIPVTNTHPSCSSFLRRALLVLNLELQLSQHIWSAAVEKWALWNGNANILTRSAVVESENTLFCHQRSPLKLLLF